MSLTTNARDRAEEMFQLLQKRARELLDAEEGLARTVRDMVEQAGISPVEVRKSLEELLGRLGANKIVERLRATEPSILWSDTVDGFERRVDTSIHWLLSSLQIASADDMRDMRDDLAAMRERLDQIDARLKVPRRTTPKQPSN